MSEFIFALTGGEVVVFPPDMELRPAGADLGVVEA